MIYLFLNSSNLGGAERSSILQAKMLGFEDIVFCIPRIEKNENDNLEKFLSSEISNPKIEYFDFEKSLYQVSRSGHFSSIKLFFSVLKAIFSFRKFLIKLKISPNDVVWSNGNKTSILFLLTNLIFKVNCRFIWHFRDYPDNSIFFRIVKKLFFLIKRNPFVALANSKSVMDKLKEFFPKNTKVDFVYNPAGEFDYLPKNGFKILGLASMLAPWKGIHDVLLSIAIERERFLSLGFEKIYIYGAQIYKTEGEHTNYFDDLITLIKKLKIEDIVVFQGSKEPRIIMGEIDLLIHSSLRPEPFGRVLIEAMSSGVPVCSTGLGGALEVIGENEERGWRYFPFHPQSLINTVEKIILSKNLNQKLLSSKQWVQSENILLKDKLKQLILN